MTKYIGPKTDGANVATQSDVGGSSLSDATPDALTPDQAGAAGTVNSAARADHAHEILCAAAGAILPDDVAAEGTASSFARSDHTHSIATAAPGTITPDAAAAEGSSTSFARADHTHAITAAAPSANLTASTTNTEGTATSFARSDHSHAITTAAPGTINPDDAAATGSSASLARADHTHAIAAASAGTITGTNAEGTSTSFARADHNHAFGSKSVPASALALGPTYETALPGSPVDGQEIYYAADATNGVIWHLRYRSAGGTYKWEFIGGSSLTAEDNDLRTVTSGTYADVPTDQVVLTIPVAGEYLVTQIATVQIVANGQFGYVSLAITNASNTVQTEASDDWGILAGSPGASGSSGNVSFTGSTTDTFTISTAGWKLRERARAVNTLTVLRRRIIAQPIRVG